MGAVSASSRTAGSGSAPTDSSSSAVSGSAWKVGRGGRQLMESRGNRSPAGESPSSSTIRPRRSRQSALAQPESSSRRCNGSTQAAGSLVGSSSRASSAARPPRCRFPDRRRVPPRRPPAAAPTSPTAPGVFVGRPDLRRGKPEPEATADNSCSATPAGSRRSPPSQGSASNPGSFHSGLPSRRQCRPICQRGNGSPGYHLPWLYCTKPVGAQADFSRAVNAETRSLLCGPSASVVHSGST